MSIVSRDLSLTMVEPKKQRIISSRVIASLDFARAISASYVVLHHIAKHRGWSQDGFGLAFRFGQEAVIIFFLLSGFVIFANENKRADLHLQGYYLRRFRRIYPALIVALLVSTLVALDNRLLFENFRWYELLGTLLNVQDIPSLKPGVIVPPYLGNDPLWSLSYEVPFYIVFPFALTNWRRSPLWTNHAVGASCCSAYLIYAIMPNHWALVASYFLIWWCGAMAGEAYMRGARDFRSIGSPLCWLIFLSLIAGGIVLEVGYRGLGVYPFLPLRHFLMAAGTLLLFFGPVGRRLALFSGRVGKLAAAGASISYGLYVLHYPLLVNWHRAQTAWGELVAFVLLLVAAYVADRLLGQLLPPATTR